jgi:hypothetical protein
MLTIPRRLALIILLLGCAASTAWGQFPRYMPPGGRTLPNELNYFRRDVGVLDPYNALVDPVRRVDRQFQQLEAQQERDFQVNRRAIRQLREARAAPTGTGAVFMNYGHYYGPNPAMRAAR